MANRIVYIGAGAALVVLILTAFLLLGPRRPDAEETRAARPSTELRPLLIGGATDAAGTRPTPASLSSEEGITFCMPRVLPGDGCLDRDAILSLDDVPPGEGRPGSGLSMVHPTDLAEPAEAISSCSRFRTLKAEGWGGLTSVDMAAEARFEKFCGLKVLARRARPAQHSAFGRRLSPDDLDAVPAEDWPSIGELAAAAPRDWARSPEQQVFRGTSRSQEIVVTDVAIADFDGDSAAEALVHLVVGPSGGTARYTTFSLIEAAGKGRSRRLRPVRWGNEP